MFIADAQERANSGDLRNTVGSAPRSGHKGHRYGIQEAACSIHVSSTSREDHPDENQGQARPQRKPRSRVKQVARNYLTDIPRFIRRIETCWIWTGPVTSSGYGRLSIACRDVTIPRWILAFSLGRPLGPEEVTRHSCDNRACCNPDHLSVGTKRENAYDAMERGRNVQGETVGTAKLTNEQADEIRRLAVNLSTRELAGYFDVSETCIRSVVNRKTYRLGTRAAQAIITIPAALAEVSR